MPGRSHFFPFERKSHIFSMSFLVYFGIVDIWPKYHSLIRGFGLRLSFYLSKRVSLCSNYEYFSYIFTYLDLIEVTKINSKCFNGKLCSFQFSYASFHKACLFSSYMHPYVVLKSLVSCIYI